MPVIGNWVTKMGRYEPAKLTGETAGQWGDKRGPRSSGRYDSNSYGGGPADLISVCSVGSVCARGSMSADVTVVVTVPVWSRVGSVSFLSECCAPSLVPPALRV